MSRVSSPARKEIWSTGPTGLKTLRHWILIGVDIYRCTLHSEDLNTDQQMNKDEQQYQQI